MFFTCVTAQKAKKHKKATRTAKTFHAKSFSGI